MNLELIHLAFAGGGLAFGALLSWALVASRATADKQALQSELDKLGLQLTQSQQSLHEAYEELSEKEQTLSAYHQQQLQTQNQLGQFRQQAELHASHIPELKQQAAHWQERWQQANDQLGMLRTQLESQAARFEEEQRAATDKLELLKQSEERLKQQFENLANQIFEKKTEHFSQSSKQSLDGLLTPLKDQIEGFKRQISDQYVKEGQERASLKTEILSLKELNRQITEEAAALTKALKGDNKQQGNWGEIVLERILTESGLREGHEYDTQGQYKDEHGKAFKPDVIVHLPNDKDVIIDAKMSLAAYERYFNEQDDSVRAAHLAEHINSIRNHIKGLGKKDYQKLDGIKTLDYVLMFVPVEAAFLLAIDQAPDLIKLALDHNIMLVSPTNLLVALRTINNIWQYEYQNQNAQHIAKKAADLYDKFVAFTEDMQGIGTSLQTVQKKYDGAINKLSEGRGNLVRRAEEFRKMGVQSSKQLSDKLLAAQLEEDEE
ncbi:DNA recombination protein RmuC [Aliiglaciecola sp. CAU 1673]|uniref:DNA recombination protein RmuC n=1 Tax=Aliiglaciecola sp. CAU 1673 TaxID=3032595 RepID=UPI0023DC52C7|nr:DNA recombination protein RmuC [Aliiglaciecola sp. CAU 1673]MDF2178881.1 DNA recombination protein RmuC [Aliiglaciecola sp. CAU 1673]